MGPYFRVEPWRPGAGWRPLRELVDGPDAFAERVAAGAATLARLTGVAGRGDELDRRAVTSTVFLGLVARLVSPPLATLVVEGTVPPWTVASLWWQPTEGGPWPLASSQAVPGATGGRVESEHEGPDPADGPGWDADRDAVRFGQRVVDGVVAPVLDRVAWDFSLSRRLLWGNVASALAGAAGMLATQRPDRAERAAQVVGRVLEHGDLAGSGDLVRPDPASPRRFLVRRSCCLFYRVPGGGLCGDCVLVEDDVRARQWADALSAGR